MCAGEFTIGLIIAVSLLGHQVAAERFPNSPWTMTDYDEGDWYVVRGEEKLSYHGMLQPWVYNRAMVWLDGADGLDGAILCYSRQSPLPLTGTKQVSKWFTQEANLLEDVDENFTRFVKRSTEFSWDHACLPPLQFSIEQHPVAELVVRRSTAPWQFFVVVKGRSGPPLFVTPWQEGPAQLRVDLRELYRQKGYRHQFAEFVFFMALMTKSGEWQGVVEFSLQLVGGPTVAASLPVIRTADRAAREGIPVYAVVLDEKANRLGPEAVRVVATLGSDSMPLSASGDKIWHARFAGLPAGDYWSTIEATWHDGSGRKATGKLRICITDGQYVDYDPELRLLCRGGKPLGPVTGSYRGQILFRQLGRPEERPLRGEADWWEAIADRDNPDYGFHFWEALTPAELDADYAYLARCGWQMIHLCSGWLWWPRWDAAGYLSPFYAEQLCEVSTAARRHGLMLLLALSHYPLGQASPPYAQYLEAGYDRGDYTNLQSTFYRMFGDYLRQFAEIFRDDTTIALFTASGEGDHACGPTFINFVHDVMARHSPRHLFACEPHWKIVRYPNFYRQEGWKPLLGGMRTYFIDGKPPEAIGVQFKLAGMGHLFMAEGCFYGFLGGNHQYMDVNMPVDSYRQRIRETIYTGLAHRNPILLTWEERIVEDERIVFDQIRRQVNWSTNWLKPPVAIRVGARQMPPEARAALFRYEAELSEIPVEAFYLWEDEPAPPGTAVVIDARKGYQPLGWLGPEGRLPETIARHLPLRLPAGWAANYSWSEDRRTLLAFLRKLTDAATWSAEEGGPYSYVDTTLTIPRETTVAGWEVFCLRPGEISLRIYRQDGDLLLLVYESPLERMRAPGWCKFTLPEPWKIRAGDLVGFYIPGENTRIAAAPTGRMLFQQGPSQKRSRLSQWEEEPKSAAIRLVDEATSSEDQVRVTAPLAVRNFPDDAVRFRLYDLQEKTCVREGEFCRTLDLELGEQSRHLFLVVTPD